MYKIIAYTATAQCRYKEPDIQADIMKEGEEEGEADRMSIGLL
jgi:hypothetical protein